MTTEPPVWLLDINGVINEHDVEPLTERVSPEALADILAIVDGPHRPELDAQFENNEDLR